MTTHTFFVILLTGINLLGIASALHAIMKSHSSQGAIAWAISLFLFPYIALLPYWSLGRNHLSHYAKVRQSRDRDLYSLWKQVEAVLQRQRYPYSQLSPYLRSIEKLARLPLFGGNSVQVLINGKASFQSILAGIRNARLYICFQFYIIKDDAIGREIQQALIDRARSGVRVYFLYDRVGSFKLKRQYVQALRQAGVECYDFSVFRPSQFLRFPYFNWLSRLSEPLRINFRNHRKLVIVDGHSVWLGGHNIGDEYMGRGPLGFWRDTHQRISGPAVLSCQLSFVEDWYWVSGQVPELCWECSADCPSEQLSESNSEAPSFTACSNVPVLIIPGGPADELDTTRLMFVHAIHSARERIWLASPYFVPDDSVLAALQLAGLRGVDVRIIVPDKPDHRLVYLAAFSFFAEASATGVRIYRYKKGFLHQKIMILDDQISSVGTANLDNRSFHLNFEITAMSIDARLQQHMSQVFLKDLEHSYLMCPERLSKWQKNFLFRLLVQIARLFAPLL